MHHLITNRSFSIKKAYNKFYGLSAEEILIFTVLRQFGQSPQLLNHGSKQKQWNRCPQSNRNNTSPSWNLSRHILHSRNSIDSSHSASLNVSWFKLQIASEVSPGGFFLVLWGINSWFASPVTLAKCLPGSDHSLAFQGSQSSVPIIDKSSSASNSSHKMLGTPSPNLSTEKEVQKCQPYILCKTFIQLTVNYAHEYKKK